EQAGLQSIAGGVDGVQGLREIVISFHGFYRSKNLFAVYAHVRGRASEHGGLEQCAMTLASAQQLGSCRHRLLNPLRRALGIRLADKRSKVGGFVLRITHLQLGNTCEKSVQKFLIDTALDQNTLHRDAALSGVGESAGKPACCTTSANSTAVSGVCGAGFRTMVQPQAMAGATLWATRFNGKLNGVMAAMAPMGKRRTMPQRPAVEACRSIGRYSPPMRPASSAATVKVKTARSTSARAVLMGFPACRQILRANSSCRCAMPCATSRKIRWRSKAGKRHVVSNVRTAAAIAC